MKLVITAVLLTASLFSQSSQAQLLRKLKEKVAGSPSQSQGSGTSQDGRVAEEKVKNVGNSFSIKTNYGVVKYDIDQSAEVLADFATAEGRTRHFLTTTKKQYVLHSISSDKNDVTTMMEKTVVNKEQIAYCANTRKYVDGQFVVSIFLQSQANQKRIRLGDNVESDVSSFQFTLYAKSAEQANQLLSTLLGKDLAGTQLNTFVYTTGDGKIVRTGAKPFWVLQDGQLYLESLPREKALRVTYVEINMYGGENRADYLVKVTVIPSDAIGDYRQFSFEGKDFYLPLKKAVTKTIYDKQASPTTETITERFRLASNNFGSEITNEYCTIVSEQLPADVREKFKREVQQPIVAKRLAEEKERDRLYAESQRNAGAGSGASNSGASKGDVKAKTEFYVRLRNKGESKLDIEVWSPRGSSKQLFSITSRSSKSVKVQVGSRVFVNRVQVTTISAGMEDQDVIVAQ